MPFSREQELLFGKPKLFFRVQQPNGESGVSLIHLQGLFSGCCDRQKKATCPPVELFSYLY
jgi:hypothetical protein